MIRLSKIVFVSGALVCASATLLAQSTPMSIPSTNYTLDESFFKMPMNRAIGSVAGIFIHPDQSSIWLFDRCGANNCVGSDLAPIMQFDLAGNLL